MTSTAAGDGAEATTIIRAARGSDGDAVFALLAQLGAETAADRSEFDHGFSACLRSPDPTFLRILEHEGVVRGYALTSIVPLLSANGTSAQVQEIVVDTALRGSGLGRLLLEAVEVECRNRGVRQVTVASRRSAGFYEKQGWVRSADFLRLEL